VQCLLVGALLALIARVVLALPADLFSRLVGTAVRDPAPGTLPRWLQSPLAEEEFLRLFVTATWWVGAVAGVVLSWRRGGRWADLLFGLVAGAGAGLAGGATAGCVLALIDAAPRAVLALALHDAALPVVLSTLLWLLVAVASWSALGAALGLGLSLLGRRGVQILRALAAPLAWLFGVVGLDRLANFFALRG
jgi:hypothetical protein